MKRINPKTGQNFERGDLREDGYYFYRYRMDRKLNPDGFYKEEWSSNPVRKSAKWITTEKAKIKGSKRINPETNKPFVYGDLREDGYIFDKYDTSVNSKTGFLKEKWLSKQALDNQKTRQAEYKKRNYHSYDPDYHIKRINPKTGKLFSIGDRDEDGRYFIRYRSGAYNKIKKIDEMWVDTKHEYIKFNLARSLAKIVQRGKKRNFPVNIDTEYLLSIYPKDEMCPALKIKMEFGGTSDNRFNSPSIDRIIPKKGYIKGNIRFVSFLANAIMNDANADEILKVGEWLKKQNVNRHEDR
jgi:hypothetical protein